MDTGHIDLHERVKDRADCRERGCTSTYMDYCKTDLIDDDGDEVVLEAWLFTHRTADRSASLPVSCALVEDAPMFENTVPTLLAQAHEAIDRLPGGKLA